MRIVLQRVLDAECRVENVLTGEIKKGLVIFVGIDKFDTYEDVNWITKKIPRIRCFEDTDGKMNCSADDVGGELLLISQFTLFGNLRKGTRPSFNQSAPPDLARDLFNQLVEQLHLDFCGHVATGKFGRDMKINMTQDGPVTLIID